GLAGVAERARLLGGSATAGPCEGDWVLEVTLPTGAAPRPRTGEETR
ncbi:histidine kinase, partial [Streptomyces albidoflavus]